MSIIIKISLYTINIVYSITAIITLALSPVNFINYVNFVNFDIVDLIIDYNLIIVDS